MTGRTHDLAAFTAITITLSFVDIEKLSLATALVCFGANMVGGLAPDLDQSTADLYSKIRGGRILAKILDPLIGSHRMMSHSILGIIIFGFIAKFIFESTKHVLLVDMTIVWYSFLIGFISHLVMDSFTREGVPWFFPIPKKIGFPPFRFLRIKTGGRIEKYIVFPGLILINVYFIYSYYDKFIEIINNINK